MRSERPKAWRGRRPVEEKISGDGRWRRQAATELVHDLAPPIPSLVSLLMAFATIDIAALLLQSSPSETRVVTDAQLLFTACRSQ
jgi:hypothetical protein